MLKDVLRDFFQAICYEKSLQTCKFAKNLLICETYLVVSQSCQFFAQLTSIMVVIFVKSSVTIWLVIKCMIIVLRLICVVEFLMEL